jgi:hypothetical protein
VCAWIWFSEIKYSQLKINHLKDTPSTKAAAGGIYSGVLLKDVKVPDCDNIHSWISTTGDLAFSHQQEFTVLNSQKGFRRSLLEISLFSLFSLFY